MWLNTFCLVLFLQLLGSSQNVVEQTSSLYAYACINAYAEDNNGTVAGRALGPDTDGKYMISAPGIRALFIPYGASISNLLINDSRGIESDIVIGFDNASYYSIDR
jgi:aldose 1-epimerase